MTRLKEKINYLAATIGIILMFVAIFLLMWTLLRGTTRVSGEYPNDIGNQSLSCHSNKLTHPYAKYDNSEKKNLNINALFNAGIKTISLNYELYYNNAEAIANSEAQNHAAINISLSDNGIKTTALSPSYSRQNDRMVMTLFTESVNFDEKVAKYYMANGLNENSSFDEFLKNYQSQGFECSYNE